MASSTPCSLLPLSFFSSFFISFLFSILFSFSILLLLLLFPKNSPLFFILFSYFLLIGSSDAASGELRKGYPIKLDGRVASQALLVPLSPSSPLQVFQLEFQDE